MPVCARAIQQPDGSAALVLDTTATDLSACAYVVQTGAELGNSLVSFTAQEGALLSSGVIAVWLAAYFIRGVIDVVQGSTNET